ncbi:MAG: hypothetical protein E7H54_05955 [Clostridium perfringens]|nr:hypothetical protein [Clostridium perfringens]
MARVSLNKVFMTIKRYYMETGVMPTIRELCKLTGVRSTSTMHKKVHQLESMGVLEVYSKSPRNYRLVTRETNKALYIDLMRVFLEHGKVLDVHNNELILRELNDESMNRIDKLLNNNFPLKE